MVKTTKEINDKDCVDKTKQLKKERKPIVYIELKHKILIQLILLKMNRLKKIIIFSCVL